MDAFGLTEERRAGGDLWGNVEPEVLEARRASPWLEDDAAWMQMKSETAFSWPKDAPFAVALSHDVDFFRRSGPWARPGRNLALAFKAGQRKSVGFAWHLKRALRNAGVLILGKDGFWGNCRPWMEVEEKHGFVSTCFFSPGEVSWRKDFDCDLRMNDRVQVDGKSLSYADVIREVRDRGGEVGLHGSYYAAESAEVLREQKLEMESVLGGAVEAYRNHFLHYVPGVTELLLNDAGFALDSTLGYNRHVGYRTGFSFPHPLLHPSTEEPLACWELPMPLMLRFIG